MTDNAFKHPKIGKFIIQDGVVVDTETGLMWLRFSHGQQWKNGMIVGNSQGVTWDEAIKIPDTFNQQGYGGYDNWRIPNIDELKTLIDMVKGKEGNYIDKYVFLQNEKWFWSSSPSADYNGYAKYLNFYNGSSNGYSNKNNEYSVRLVRQITESEAMVLFISLNNSSQKIEANRPENLVSEPQTKLENEQQKKLEAKFKAELEWQVKWEKKRIAEIERQIKLEIERLKVKFQQKITLEIERLKIESERQIKLEIERFKAEMEVKIKLQANESIEIEPILEVVKVEMKQTTIAVPLLKDEATQDFEDMF